MNLRFVFCLFLISSFAVVQGRSQNKSFDKATFYKILKSGKAEEIDAQINLVKGSPINEKEAYEGALLMKRSDLFAKAKDKLNMFKSGRSKLESSIAKNSDNTEYRFLRLIIQEHAPKIVKYRNELEKDSKWIRSKFNSLSTFLQQLIIDYSKESKVLKIP
ncbi:MAG TPA: hypothetical protein VK483_17150 [Chitinophagaceae bacterium]|nr:hypothetical protein [Chitinophagaceae bacterium]